MDDVPALLRRLVATDPGRPRVTWYGPAGERVELSGKVLDNWVAKTANLLVDELDAGPGTQVVLDLPAHWRTLVWLLATWSVGARVVVERPAGTPRESPGDGPAGAPVDVLVTADPAGPAALSWRDQAERVVAVALPALAPSFGPALPAGAVDYALEVRTFGDVFVPFVRPAPTDQAYLLVERDTVLGVPYGELLRFTSHEAALAPGTRLLTGGPGVDPLLDLLGPLVADGSVVVHHDPAGAGPGGLDGLAAQEGVTVTRLRAA